LNLREEKLQADGENYKVKSVTLKVEAAWFSETLVS
jgi:hypothetical protein